jgi:hypothetical protein
MKRLRRHKALVAALVCVLLAVVLGLLAADAASWRSTVKRDDLRFRALPAHGGLWRPGTILPLDPASKIIGTGSTIDWRRANQWFWFTRVNLNPDVHMDTPTLRAETQDLLLGQLASAPSAAQRSDAANLLGVLVATTRVPGGNDRSVISQLLKRSAEYFQQSIALNPGNTDAKQNLELVLRLAKPGKGHFGRDARAGYGFGRGRGATVSGNGY